MQRFSTILSLLALFALGCRTAQPSVSGKLNQKAEPYELFSLQRSWPDRDFDWKGWRNAIQEARLEETAVERGASDCAGSGADWTIQGPGNVAGRLNCLAVHPDDENTVLAGFSGGGIFKTTDGGVNWHPVFDEQAELSIGDITYDPSDPSVVYAGTGDPNMPSIVFNGNGVYKSTDGGENWSHLGLAQQGIISKVVVHPTNPNILFAASMGNPYIRDEHRGVYRSTDGGLNWTRVLFVSNQAGASDLQINPDNPQILYASFWDRIRNNQESVIHGPHARVYKTTDGGENWTQLGGGLPTGVMGRTGLALSAQNPDKLYAIYVDTFARPGGLYKTVDGGANWTSVNINGLQDAYANFGWYFGKVRANDSNDEEVYILGILLWRKAAGSTSWQIGAGAHADCHDLAFAPSGKRYLATDGGMYTNIPGQQTWTKSKNLPTTQFYRTNFNPHEPTLYWAGAQDNGIHKGNGAGFNTWMQVFSADGFRCAFDPNDPAKFWVETQNGSIHSTTNGGNNWTIGQACLGTSDRCNWDMPFFISTHGGDWFYAATYRAYASSTGTGGWGVISGDLTDGNIYGERFHTVSALEESPITPQKLVAGTSDGNVWRREANGSWSNISAGLPDRYVTSVCGSPTLANRIFVTHSGFRDNEEIPHVHRSDDNGQTWVNISGNLPPLPVNDLLVLPGHADSLLFAATDAGVYFSANSGAQWSRLGSIMPYIPVFDLQINPALEQLVAATHARGIYTFPLDSLFAEGAPLTVSVAGGIRNESGAGISNVSINQIPGSETATDGLFQLNEVPGCDSLEIVPERNDNPINGVTTFDLVLIAKHILGIDTLDTPYRIIAADANRSNSVTTFDIVALRRLILGIDNTLNGNTSWRFIPENFNFSDPINPFQGGFPESILVQTGASDVADVDFIGLKVGDLNQTAQANSHEPHVDERGPAEWPVYAAATEGRAGESVWVDFFAEGGALAALQFTLDCDPARLEILELEPLAPGIGPEHFFLREATISVAIDFPVHPAPDPAVQPLFRVRFRLRTDGALQAALLLSESPTQALAYRHDGSAARPVLKALQPAGGDSLLPPAPNPFGAQGTWLNLPGTGQASLLRLFDSHGKPIREQALSAAPAPSRLHLPAAWFPEAGVYTWLLQQGEHVFSGKIVYVN